MAVIILLFVVLSAAFFTSSAARALPNTTKTMSFQGRLAASNGAVVPDGYYNIQFKIYQDGNGKAVGNSGGSLKWTESYVNGGSNNGVEVRNGYFSVDLGSRTSFGTKVDWNHDKLFLSMNVAGNASACSTFGSAPCSADGEMLPMKRISATPMALNSQALGGKTADNFVQLGQGVQTDASTNTSSVFINKTGSGNLMQLQNAGKDALTVSQDGNIVFGRSVDHTISVEPSSASKDGRKLTVVAGVGGAGNNGGDLLLHGGMAGASSGSGEGTNGVNVTGSENFEGHPNGTTITDVNTTFDSVYMNGSANFSNEWSINGGLSVKYVTQNFVTKSVPTTSTGAMRWYMMMPNLPTSNTTIGQTLLNSNTTSQLSLFTNGTVKLRDGGIANGTATSAIPTDTAVRVEWKVDTATSTQKAEFYWGTNLHGTTPNTATTASYTHGSFNRLNTSISISSTDFVLYVDEWAYGSDWLGPLEFATANGGGVQIDAGAKSGSGAGGSIFIGNSNASSITIGSKTAPIAQDVSIGANNVAGGSANVTIGSGGLADSGSTTIQAKNSVTIKTNGIDRATFSDTTGTVYFGNGVSSAAPDDYTLQGTNSSSGSADGGSLKVQGGDATTGNRNGGNVTLSGGSGSGTGASGLVVLTTPTISTIDNDANCYTGGSPVWGHCTITSSTVDNASAVMVGFRAGGKQATLPDPTIKTAGRLIYVIAANSSSEFTLRANAGAGANIEHNITMKQNTTATLLWNGNDWTVVGTTGGASGLQARDGGDPQLGGGGFEAFSGPELDEPITSGGDTPDQSGTSLETSPTDPAPTGDGNPDELFKLGQSETAPTADTSDELLGGMYYDTTLGKVQCYESDGWGACSDSPDSFITISPEYTNAVMNGADSGTITSDLCSDSLNINDGSTGQPTVCGSNETYNFYNWTTDKTSDQTRSIFVTYQLPSNFKDFVAGSTSLSARTDNADSSVSYRIYRDDASGGGLTACGPDITASTGSKASWQKAVASGGTDPSTCDFAAGDSILFRINLTAKSEANAYVSNLGFVFTNN